MQVDYPHQALNDGDEVALGEVSLKALYTPGHSPDHNTYLLKDAQGNPHAVFTGDSLFIGDVGRPDLREDIGKTQGKRQELAGQMYETMKQVFRKLPDDVMVYPAHGKGSLCGKNMSSDTYSTIGKEKQRNWALKEDNEKAFVEALLEGQPYVPKYFPYDVSINASGVQSLAKAVEEVPRLSNTSELSPHTLIVDARPAEAFRKGHLDGAINIPDGKKFETWLGSLIGPEEEFYLMAGDKEQLEAVIHKAAKIGYEQRIKGALTAPVDLPVKSEATDPDAVHKQPGQFTILDVRNVSEVESEPVFAHSINIPLNALRENYQEIPQDKPIAVHCAGGYRSAIGASILEQNLPNTPVHDVGESIKEIKKVLA